MALSGSASLFVKGWIISVISFGLFIGDKLSLLLFSVFTFSVATLNSKALVLSIVFLPSMSPAFFQSLYNCWHDAIDIELYSSLEHFFDLIFLLKVPLVVLVFCHLAGLVRPLEAIFELGDGALLLMYWVRKATIAPKSFSYLSGCTLIAWPL